MKKFWLVARGKINDWVVKAPDQCQSLISSRGLIDTDYMGAAEFEFGAIPRFYRRIMQRLDKAKDAYTMINLKELIGLETWDGIPFWAYVHTSDMEDFLQSMKDYTDDLKDRTKVRQWHLKEWTDIDKHLFKPSTEWDQPRYNVWYSIDGIDKYKIGDWVMMIGDKSVPDAFEKIIHTNHQTWWASLPQEEREKDYTQRF